MSEHSTSITLLEHGTQLLANASTFNEIKTIRDKAEAARKYVESVALGLQMQNSAAELKLRAERKAGAYLRQVSRHGGNRRSTSHDGSLKLRELGINYNQSARWRLEADIPEDVFEEYLKSANQQGREITSQGLLKLAKKLKQEHSPLTDINSQTLKRKARISDGKTSADSPVLDETIDDLIAEIENHHHLLESILQTARDTTGSLTRLHNVDQRMIERLFGEIKRLLPRLKMSISRIAECERPQNVVGEVHSSLNKHAKSSDKMKVDDVPPRR